MSALLMVGSFPPMRNSEPGGGQRRDAPRAPTRRLRWPGRCGQQVLQATQSRGF